MSITEQPAPRTGDRVDELLAELQDALRGAEEKCAAFVELLTGERPGPVVVPLGVCADEPPSGCALRTEYAAAEDLVLGDRVCEATRQVAGPKKDAFRHFARVDATSGNSKGQVLLGMGGAERMVPCDLGFVRVVSGRVVSDTFDGPVAHYEWEVAG